MSKPPMIQFCTNRSIIDSTIQRNPYIYLTLLPSISSFSLTEPPCPIPSVIRPAPIQTWVAVAGISNRLNKSKVWHTIRDAKGEHVTFAISIYTCAVFRGLPIKPFK
ncbi:hypothetical protein, partial [Microcoleus sp. SVA1_A4]|uniref:hypothetical protein n=1 Tax=Microcoleus sp. SVA1_A4 TaxID=2818948 RepID=UPI002FD5B4E0